MQRMKILLWLTAAVVLIGITGMAFLLSSGYAYTPASDQQTNPAYHSSVACEAKQAQKKDLEAPLLAEEKPLADKLINGPFPLDNGQQIYTQYNDLRTQVNQLETKYSC